MDWTIAQPEVDPERVAVAGSSLGAVVALQAARQKRVSPVALVLRAPPAEPADFVGLRTPSLLLVGSYDILLSVARASAARSPAVELRIVPGASHLFEEPGTLELATDATVSWLAAKLKSPSASRAVAPALR
jgi:acetyl esterase/lipase